MVLQNVTIDSLPIRTPRLVLHRDEKQQGENYAWQVYEQQFVLD
jgi:hypothetical protein